MKASKTKGRNGLVDVVLENEHVTPCPFCGSSASLHYTWTASYWMECDNCEAERHGEYAGGDRSISAHLKAARSALKNWNTRV